MLVSACVWSERPLATAGHEVGIEVAFIIELVAESPPHRRPAGVASYLT
jgi:heterodisulfide reductase subunit D